MVVISDKKVGTGVSSCETYKYVILKEPSLPSRKKLVYSWKSLLGQDKVIGKVETSTFELKKYF